MLVTGSDVDEWVPEARVRETVRVFTAKGAEVQLRVYTGRAHVISDEEVIEARAFLSAGRSEGRPLQESFERG